MKYRAPVTAAHSLLLLRVPNVVDHHHHYAGDRGMVRQSAITKQTGLSNQLLLTTRSWVTVKTIVTNKVAV